MNKAICYWITFLPGILLIFFGTSGIYFYRDYGLSASMVIIGFLLYFFSDAFKIKQLTERGKE